MLRILYLRFLAVQHGTQTTGNQGRGLPILEMCQRQMKILRSIKGSLSATLDPCMSVTEGEVRVKLINIHANTRLHLSRSEPVDLPAVSCRVLL
jgi:hypothetical protein